MTLRPACPAGVAGRRKAAVWTAMNWALAAMSTAMVETKNGAMARASGSLRSEMMAPSATLDRPGGER